MAKALIVCAEAASQALITTAGVVYKLTDIAYQKNPDGSNASFVSLSANTITLQSGIYIIEGWVSARFAVVSSTATCIAAFYNSTNSKNAWLGQDNEYSSSIPKYSSTSLNSKLRFQGKLDLTASGPDGIGPKNFQVKVFASAANQCSGGVFGNTVAQKQTFAQITIIKVV